MTERKLSGVSTPHNHLSLITGTFMALNSLSNARFWMEGLCQQTVDYAGGMFR
jgi:hypothetical protein